MAFWVGAFSPTTISVAFHSKKNPAIFISCGILGRQKHFHLFRRHSTYLVWCCWTPSLWSPRWWRAWGSSRRGSSLRTWCPHPPPPLALPSPQQWGVPTAGSFLYGNKARSVLGGLLPLTPAHALFHSRTGQILQTRPKKSLPSSAFPKVTLGMASCKYLWSLQNWRKWKCGIIHLQLAFPGALPKGKYFNALIKIPFWPAKFHSLDTRTGILKSQWDGMKKQKQGCFCVCLNLFEGSCSRRKEGHKKSWCIKQGVEDKPRGSVCTGLSCWAAGKKKSK